LQTHLSISSCLNRLTSAEENRAMKFLCIVFIDEKKFADMPRDEFQALEDASLGHDQTLRQSGRFVASQALHPVRMAATVKVRNGKPMITDGPFAETKEQVGGFLLIEARDREEAIALAAKLPVASYGTIEVRPVRELGASTAQR
jgi:hypothetical protein